MKTKKSTSTTNNAEKPPPKKRGRKPKGGKIVKEVEEQKEVFIEKQSIILHLKCHMKDAEPFSKSHMKYDPNIVNYEPYSENTNYESIQEINETMNLESAKTINEQLNKEKDSAKMKKSIDQKLKELEKVLNTNEVIKKSACFWCTYDFNSQPIYIPSLHHKGKYHVYGCFCSPECACSHLLRNRSTTILNLKDINC